MELEAIPEWNYEIEDNPESQNNGTIDLYTTFVRPANMAPILTRSRFSCSLPAEELIKDDMSPRKEDLHYFLRESKIDEDDARELILKLTHLAAQVTSSDEYSPKYALSMWLTLDLVPSSEESVLDDPETEEAILASLADETLDLVPSSEESDDPETEEAILASLSDETKSGFRPTSKLGLRYLSKRKFKRKQKASSSNADRCTICLKAFKTRRRVRTLPCDHEFHYKCILEWLKVSHFCPLCRYELPCEDDENFPMTTLVT